MFLYVHQNVRNIYETCIFGNFCLTSRILEFLINMNNEMASVLTQMNWTHINAILTLSSKHMYLKHVHLNSNSLLGKTNENKM